MEHQAPVIRMVRKKVVHGGHHGGSWKVAYADFVTAMMAFFLVMWIISMDQPVREQIQNYFNDPASASSGKAGISRLASGGMNPLASGFAGALDSQAWHEAAAAAQRDRLNRAGIKLRAKLAGRPDLARLRSNVEIRVSSSGLQIELLERSEGMFFDSGSAAVPPDAREVLKLIAGELGRLANPVVIEGHTDSVPFSGRQDYTNWELSADRANAARRVMRATGLRPDQVVEVRGYADSRLRDPDHPRDASNRRVTVLVPFGENRETASEAESDVPKKPFKVQIGPWTEHGEPKVSNLKVQPHL